MNVSEAIKTKRAVRLFTKEPVPEATILAILEAGRRSQSSKNTQPWQFVVVRDRAKLEALSKLGDFAGHLAGAAFAIALVGTTTKQRIDFDLGQASAYLQLQAWELGVGSCIATMYHPDQAKALLNIPADMHLINLLSCGFPSPDFKPAKLGGRKPINEVVKWDSWT